MDLFDISLYASYLLVIIAVLTALILPLVNSLSDPKSLLKGFIGIGILLVVFFIGYMLAGDEVTTVYMKNNVDAGASKLIGGALVTMYVFFIVSFASIILTEILKLFK